MYTFSTIQSDRAALRKKLIDDIALRKNLKGIQFRKSEYNNKFVDYNPLSSQNLSYRRNINFDAKPIRVSVDTKEFQNMMHLNRIKSITTRNNSSNFLIKPKPSGKPSGKQSGRLSPIATKFKNDNERITCENLKFFNKLVRVHSPLSKKKMDKHFENFKETKYRITKVRTYNLEKNFSHRKIGSMGSCTSFNLPSIHSSSPYRSFKK